MLAASGGPDVNPAVDLTRRLQYCRPGFRVAVHGVASTTQVVGRLDMFLRVFFLGLVMTLIDGIGDVTAQAPAQPTIEGNIYSVTYVEVMPTSRADGVALLK